MLKTIRERVDAFGFIKNFYTDIMFIFGLILIITNIYIYIGIFIGNILLGIVIMTLAVLLNKPKK